MFDVYRNPELSDKVQSVERKATFLCVGNANAHHEEWLGSCATNLHSRAARDFASLSGL